MAQARKTEGGGFADPGAAPVTRVTIIDSSVCARTPSQLRDFGVDHDLAVGLVPVPSKVLLMVRLGRVEHIEGCDFRDDRIRPNALRGQLYYHRLCGLPLLRRVVEDRRSVLRPDVHPPDDSESWDRAWQRRPRGFPESS